MRFLFVPFLKRHIILFSIIENMLFYLNLLYKLLYLQLININFFYKMRLLILATLFLVPLLWIASFPIENETTEIINEIYNQASGTNKPWYNTWWAILLNVIILIPFSSIVFLS